MSASAARRTSTTTHSERRDVGDPYKIYTEIVNTGKNVGGTKKKVKWIFGFTDSNDEYEVVLIHSLVSGKKTIIENGVEVNASASVLSTDFSYGWSSRLTHRFYRVEVQIQLTSENVYVFSVDGMPFTQMPDKTMVRARSMARKDSARNSRYGSEDMGTVAQPPSNASTANRSSLRASSGTVGNTSNNRLSVGASSTTPARKSFQSQNTKSSPGGENLFDPFASGTDAAPFDPFTSSPSAAAPSTTTPTKATTKSPNVGAAAALFDAVNDASPSFDAFGSGPISSSATPKYDVFGESHSASAGAPDNSSSNFDPFGGTTEKHKAVGGLPISKVSAHGKSPSNAFDVFDDQALTSTSSSHHRPQHQQEVDLFGDKAVAPSTSSASRPSRRASAQEISMDFAGLSFQPAAAVLSAQTSASEVTAPAVVPKSENVEKGPVDVWATNLVDLDLTGKTQQPKRNASSTGGPSLDSMMGVSGGSQRRASMNNGAQLKPADILNSMNDPFGAPALLSATQQTYAAPPPTSMPNKPAMSAPLAISSLGGPTQPMVPMSGGYGGAMPPRAPHMGGPGGPMVGGGTMPQHRGSIGPTMGSTMGGRPAAFVPGAPFSSGNMQPKSSLDSLDWKAI